MPRSDLRVIFLKRILTEELEDDQGQLEIKTIFCYLLNHVWYPGVFLQAVFDVADRHMTIFGYQVLDEITFQPELNLGCFFIIGREHGNGMNGMFDKLHFIFRKRRL
jgi:hypothetical protein